jgi:hypothetical protein
MGSRFFFAAPKRRTFPPHSPFPSKTIAFLAGHC